MRTGRLKALTVQTCSYGLVQYLGVTSMLLHQCPKSTSLRHEGMLALDQILRYWQSIPTFGPRQVEGFSLDWRSIRPSHEDSVKKDMSLKFCTMFVDFETTWQEK